MYVYIHTRVCINKKSYFIKTLLKHLSFIKTEKLHLIWKATPKANLSVEKAQLFSLISSYKKNNPLPFQ